MHLKLYKRLFNPHFSSRKLFKLQSNEPFFKPSSSQQEREKSQLTWETLKASSTCNSHWYICNQLLNALRRRENHTNTIQSLLFEKIFFLILSISKAMQVHWKMNEKKSVSRYIEPANRHDQFPLSLLNGEKLFCLSALLLVPFAAIVKLNRNEKCEI